jgi:hypothetical protein
VNQDSPQKTLKDFHRGKDTLNLGIMTDYYQVTENLFPGLLKKVQMQGIQNPAE